MIDGHLIYFAPSNFLKLIFYVSLFDIFLISSIVISFLLSLPVFQPCFKCNFLSIRYQHLSNFKLQQRLLTMSDNTKTSRMIKHVVACLGVHIKPRYECNWIWHLLSYSMCLCVCTLVVWYKRLINSWQSVYYSNREMTLTFQLSTSNFSKCWEANSLITSG